MKKFVALYYYRDSANELQSRFHHFETTSMAKAKAHAKAGRQPNERLVSVEIEQRGINCPLATLELELEKDCPPELAEQIRKDAGGNGKWLAAPGLHPLCPSVPSVAPPFYPARPINGGPLDKALPKANGPGGAPWYYEPKYNGWRALVHVPTGAMFNRKLEPLSIAAEFKPALDQLRCTLDADAFQWADCEALERRHGIGRGTLIVLDVIPESGRGQGISGLDCGLAVSGYAERKLWLTPVLPTLGHFEKPPPDSLFVSPHFAAEEALDLWHDLAQSNRDWRCEFYEGLVAKRADSPYPRQRRSPDVEFPFWMKHRWAF
ncbi:MAG: hypothetical protein KGL39_45090 [Patescibacteria group bacterium]|nr:hypothetical protein [Patescibacteria group bacterium]